MKEFHFFYISYQNSEMSCQKLDTVLEYKLRIKIYKTGHINASFLNERKILHRFKVLLFSVNILTKAYLFYSIKPCQHLQNYARHESNKNNLSISNLHFFQQDRVAQLVERLALDPEARV